MTTEQPSFRESVEALLRQHSRWAERPERVGTYLQWEDLQAVEGDRRVLPTDLAVVRTLGSDHGAKR